MSVCNTFFRVQIQPYINPELQIIRNSLLILAQDNEKFIKNALTTMIEDVKGIHTSCLFKSEGKPILQIICLLLSGTKTSFYGNGWDDFASKLKLNSLVINVSITLPDLKIIILHLILLVQLT